MVSDRSSVGFLWWAMARRSSPASIHRGRVLTGRRGSGTPDFVPACRHRGGSAFGTPGTSTVASTHSETRDRRHAAADSRARMEQRCGRSTEEKSRAICGCGVLFCVRGVLECVPLGAVPCSPVSSKTVSRATSNRTARGPQQRVVGDSISMRAGPYSGRALSGARAFATRRFDEAPKNSTSPDEAVAQVIIGVAPRLSHAAEFCQLVTTCLDGRELFVRASPVLAEDVHVTAQCAEHVEMPMAFGD